jgi:DNA polymerase-3 subunit gamma/tau
VILAFKYPIHKEKMETEENQRAAKVVIGNFLGRPCQVRCVYEPEDNHLVEAAKKFGAQITSVEEK